MRAVPLDMWFRDSLKHRMTASLEGPRILDSGIFDREALKRIGTDHKTGRRDYSAVLWALLMFDGFLASTAA